MAKIEIDEKELKKVICDAFVEMMTNKSTAVVWEEGNPSKEVVCDLTKACNKVKGDIDQEFEETVRGDLMNLKLIKKHLEEVRPTAKTKDEYLRVMKFIDADISNLDKFVEERWGHDEED